MKRIKSDNYKPENITRRNNQFSVSEVARAIGYIENITDKQVQFSKLPRPEQAKVRAIYKLLLQKLGSLDRLKQYIDFCYTNWDVLYPYGTPCGFVEFYNLHKNEIVIDKFSELGD